VAVVVAAVAAECQVAVSRGAEWPRVAFHVPEWPRAALVLPVLTGTVAARGTAVTTGTAVIGTTIGEIRTVDGAGGTATSGASPGTTSCSSVVSVFHGGGAGAGALGQAGAGAAGAGAAATVTTVTVIRTTVAAMAIPITATVMDMAMDTGMDTVLSFSTEGTETAANPESPNCSAVFHALVTIMDPSTESWGRKLGAQSGTTSKNTVT